MRVFIAGIDGYLGWSLACYLARRGYTVGGADAALRRNWVSEVGGCSAIPVEPLHERTRILKLHHSLNISVWEIDLRSYFLVKEVLSQFRPDAVIHFGECPSAPYSMIDVEHATFVQTNNLTTTFNLIYAIRDVARDAHFIKLGTMGEYGTPDVDIPEGFFDVEYHGRTARMPFPRQANSWYHWSKVHGSNNIMFACDLWDLRATDIMQGVVYGINCEHSDATMPPTRFDFDQCFGTVINRFSTQVIIGHPLTVFGSGKHKRAFIPLEDSMRCLALCIENPPSRGEYRVFNQFAEVYTIAELAKIVKQVAENELGIEVKIGYHENPRHESEEHYYKPESEGLRRLGYKPKNNIQSTIGRTIKSLLPYRYRIEAKKDNIIPTIRWQDNSQKIHQIEKTLL
ncbi:MAG: NAD-dependent epimerase/dehydratase family protein [Cyanobacteria bacterium P01_F01_bin.86]